MNKIRVLLDEGHAFLEARRPHDALLAFERAALGAPDSADVRAGLDAARAALGEAERAADAGLAAADRARAEGRADDALAILVPIARGGLRAVEAAARLERLAPGEARFAAPRPADGAASARAAVLAERSRSRLVFAVFCLALFALLGAGIAAAWDDLIEGLSRAPSPRSEGGPTVAGETGPADPTTRARRLMAAGHPAAALVVLDAISPEDPSWPLARQLRGQVQGALRPAAPPAVRP